MWIVIQFWFHSGLFLLKTIPPPPFCSHNGLGMTDYVLMKYPRHCCNKFVPKNKIDYLNLDFHIEKKCCSYIPICQKVIFIFDIFLNFPTCDIFRDVRHFLEKKKIWSIVTKLWFMKRAYFTKKSWKIKSCTIQNLSFLWFIEFLEIFLPPKKELLLNCSKNESFLLPCSTNGFFPKLKSDLINEIFLCTCALHDARDTTISH